MDDDTKTMRKTIRLEDLAELAGVSISTVSRALNDSPSVNRRTKEHIWQLARKMDYPFRRYMPAGPIGADATIAIVIPQPQSREDIGNDPFLFQLLAGISSAARDRNCDVLISHISAKNYDDLSSAMRTSRARGVIFIGQSFLQAEFNRLGREESNFVVWGANFAEQDYCSVGSDNTAGGRRATSHLIRLGRRRVVFLGDIQAPEAFQRHQGYVAAHEEAGLAVNDMLMLPSYFDVESAEATIDAFIQSGVAFDGVVAASDLLAFGAIRALFKAGRSVPEDVSVVGYDNIAFSRVYRPALTTISQDTNIASRILVSKLLNGPDSGMSLSERIPTDLIVRESCGG